MKLPLEYEANISSFKEIIEANPPCSFDDLTPFESIEQLEFEVCKYPKFPIPQMSNYDPFEVNKPMRPGCEYESIIK